ncbi:hypothetical protein ACFBZI_08480 [Moraxella sp. ZJ142]|uniref:DUF968 domain-containing protein n=1 Tax=Moraxella marmotae TaxID=3344520 RepID=UPI0035D4F1BC
MTRLQKIRQMSCVGCGANPPSQAAHANWQAFGKGMGKKADDEFTIPLCHACHRKLDQYQGIHRQYAKDWFMGKLELVNRALSNY